MSIGTLPPFQALALYVEFARYQRPEIEDRRFSCKAFGTRHSLMSIRALGALDALPLLKKDADLLRSLGGA